MSVCVGVLGQARTVMGTDRNVWLHPQLQVWEHHPVRGRTANGNNTTRDHPSFWFFALANGTCISILVDVDWSQAVKELSSHYVSPLVLIFFCSAMAGGWLVGQGELPLWGFLQYWQENFLADRCGKLTSWAVLAFQNVLTLDQWGADVSWRVRTVGFVRIASLTFVVPMSLACHLRGSCTLQARVYIFSWSYGMFSHVFKCLFFNECSVQSYSRLESKSWTYEETLLDTMPSSPVAESGDGWFELISLFCGVSLAHPLLTWLSTLQHPSSLTIIIERSWPLSRKKVDDYLLSVGARFRNNVKWLVAAGWPFLAALSSKFRSQLKKVLWVPKKPAEVGKKVPTRDQLPPLP